MNDPMTTPQNISAAPSADVVMPNGPVLAALMSAGVGCFFVGFTTVLAAASKPLSAFFSMYKPSGALSGESTIAVVIWLIVWAVLARRWSGRTLALGKVLGVSCALLFLGLLMTFPPLVRVLSAL